MIEHMPQANVNRRGHMRLHSHKQIKYCIDSGAWMIIILPGRTYGEDGLLLWITQHNIQQRMYRLIR